MDACAPCEAQRRKASGDAHGDRSREARPETSWAEPDDDLQPARVSRRSADAVARTRIRREWESPSADAERRMWPARNPVYDLVGQNDVQERAVHVQPAVVLDEAQLQAPSQINPTR